MMRLVGDPLPFRFDDPPWSRLQEVAGSMENAGRAFRRRWSERSLSIGDWWRRTLGPATSLAESSEQQPRVPGAGAVLLLPAIPWSFRFQRPQQLGRALARAGYPVLFVDGFRRSRLQPATRIVSRWGNLAVLRLRLAGAPDLYQGIPWNSGREAAERIARGLLERPSFILVQHPSWFPVAIRLRELFGCPLIYDLIDLHRGFPGASRTVDKIESLLLEAADAVTATSRALASHAVEGRCSRVRLVRNGVDLNDFHPASTDAVPEGPPVLAYVGALSEWVDENVLAQLAASDPRWKLRLAGRIESAAIARLRHLHNVDLLGEIPYSEVPRLLAQAAVLLIPFRDTPLTRAVDPVKLYEGLACGVPVVASGLREIGIRSEPLVYMARETDDFTRQVRRAILDDCAEHRRRRRRWSEEQTWTARAADLLDLARELAGAS